MENSKKAVLASIGVKWEDEIRRFCENEELYLSFLFKFEKDPYFQMLKEALENEQYLDAFEAGHTLKGVAGNLGLGDLYTKTGVIVEKLRPVNRVTSTVTMDDLGPEIMSQFKECRQDFAELEEVYQKTIKTIAEVQ